MAIQKAPPQLPTFFRIPIEAHRDDKGNIRPNALRREDYDDKPPYIRRPLSQYEGFKRLDKALEKLELRDKAKESICDVCKRRCKATRLIPHVDGRVMFGPASRFGKVLVCCDGKDGCAARLTAQGCVATAIQEKMAMARLGVLGINIAIPGAKGPVQR